MLKTIITFILLMISLTAAAQKETYDLITYTPPAGWKKEVRENSHTSYTKVNRLTGKYCQIFIMPSANSKGSLDKDFDSEWQTLVQSNYAVTQAPTMTATATVNGWQTKGGTAPFSFNNAQSVVFMTTMSGFNRMMSIVAITDDTDFMPEIRAVLDSVDILPQSTSIPVKTTDPKSSSPASSGGNHFSFDTTNFDDGWTSTVQQDWVQVSKGNLQALIHYPNKQADAYNFVLLDGLKIAWDVLVAPRYSSAVNMHFKPISSWESIDFAEADMTEKASGRRVHVVLFKRHYNNGSGKYIEFIAPDKQTFEREFGAYHETTSGWENMEKIANYNKFAVAAADLAGKWTSNFSAAIQYVSAVTGFDAGMDTHASNESFNFGPGSNYQWDIGIASGPVGNIRFQSVKSSGNFKMTGNWQLDLSDIEGKPRSYSAYFSCIKGLRILWLDDKAYAKAE